MEIKHAVAALTMAAGLGLAPEASAEHREYDRYGYGMESVRRLASQLEETVEDVTDAAAAERHRGTSREELALRRLEAFQSRARHFHRQVRSNSRDRAHTEGDFRALLSAYNRAAGSFPSLHAGRSVRRDFGRAAGLMDRLAQAYGGRAYDDDRYRRRGRGHDDDDDDWDD